MPNESPHFGLDIDVLKTATLEEASRHVVLFSREARNASFEQRVNPVVVSLAEFAKLVKPDSDLTTDIATAKIYFWAKNNIPTEKTTQIWLKSSSPTMEEILLQILLLPANNPDSIMFWVSPKGNDYQEARLNLYQVIMVNGRKYLFFWGIPTDHSDENCLVFVQKLCGSRFKDAEDLRVNPFALQISENLVTFLQKNIALRHNV